MAETLVSVYDVLARMADELDELKYFRISTISTGGTQYIECGSQAAVAANIFRYGIARVQGKGTRQIAAQGNAYTTAASAGGKFTLATALSSAAVVGETLDVGWHNEQKYGQALAAVRAAIETSPPYWYREMMIDRDSTLLSDGVTTHTAVTLDDESDEYALSTDIYKLAMIGVQMDSTDDEIRWLERLDLWRTIGQEGAWRLKFYRGASGEYLPSKYDGKTLCFHYMAREPMPSDLVTASIKMPIEPLALVAANIYKRRNLFSADSELRTENVALPQLQQAGAEAWARLGYLKQPLKMGRKWGALVGE